MGFIARQPNGLICRFSTVCDCLSAINMTDEGYVHYCEKYNIATREDALDTIRNYMRPFSWVNEYFNPNNMTKKTHEYYVQKCKEPYTGPEEYESCDIDDIDYLEEP